MAAVKEATIDLRAEAAGILRELGDLGICQTAEQTTDPAAAKKTQTERDVLARRFVDVMTEAAAETVRRLMAEEAKLAGEGDADG